MRFKPDSKLEAWLKDYAADPKNWGEEPEDDDTVDRPAVRKSLRPQR